MLSYVLVNGYVPKLVMESTILTYMCMFACMCMNTEK